MFQAPSFLHTGYKYHSWFFRKADMERSIAGKIIVVTGANSGLGRSAAESLAARDASVHMVCRSKERGQKAVDEIKEATKNPNVFLHVCDVSLLSDIRRFAEQFVKENERCDVLINNAGALASERVETKEGHEQTLACHLLGPVLLTRLFEPLLHKSEDPRVINVASAGMYAAKLDVNDLEQKNVKFNGTRSYAQMKRAQVLITEMMAKEYEKDPNNNIKINTMHPGWAQSGGLGPLFDQYPMYKKLLPLFRKTAEGADTIVWMSVVPFESLKSGKFYFDRKPRFTHVTGSDTYNTHEEEKTLWDQVAKMTSE